MIKRIIDEIQRAPGVAKKAAVLTKYKDVELLRQVLAYTYEPLQMYYIKKLPWQGRGILTLENTAWMSLLKLLHNGTYSGQAAKDKVKNFIELLTYEDGEILKNIISKDLRCGISVATITKVWPGLVSNFGVMRAKAYEVRRHTDTYYMSLKIDGLRGVYRAGQLYTRNGHVIQGVQHLLDALKDSPWDLDGELSIPGSHFQATSGNIRSFDNSPDVIFSVFDLPSHTDRFSVRYTDLVDHVDTELKHPNIKLVKHVLTNDAEKIQSTFTKAIAAGYEGLVLKTPDHLYQNKRSSDWLKIKLNEDEDLPVVGFFEGEGRLAGTLGGIIVQRDNGVLVRVGSGFSDADRNEVWGNREHFIDMIAEVQYHEETPDGSLRHPRFKTFRGDKS